MKHVIEGNKAGEKFRYLASAPEEMLAAVKTAEDSIARYFDARCECLGEGSISIHDERYVLVKAASLSAEFFDLVMSFYADRPVEEARGVASGILYDVAHALGKTDARTIFRRMNLMDPLVRLAAGTVHFARAGWGRVVLAPDYDLRPASFRIMYEHEHSFEAASWLKNGRKSERPVCIMNAGYSSGWTEESFEIPLASVEISCRARGEEKCLFVMAPPEKIAEALDYYAEKISLGRKPEKGKLSEIRVFFDRKRLEDELIQSRETARVLLNAASGAAMLLTPDGRIEAINDVAARRLEAEPDDLVGKNYFNVSPPAVLTNRQHLHKAALQTGSPLTVQEMIGDSWFETHINPVKNQSGEVTRIAVYSNDITRLKDSEAELSRRRQHLEEQVRARAADLETAYNKLLQAIDVRERTERELRDEKERLAVTLKSIGEGVIVADIRGMVASMNPAAEKITGKSSPAVKNRPIDEVLPLVNLKSPQREPVSVYLRMTADESARVMEYVGLATPGGAAMELICSITPMRDNQNEVIGYVVVIRDVTEERRMEEELLRQKKIESLSILAGGLAHDFNNLLTGILGNISLVKFDTPRDNGNYKRLEACETAGMRAQKLTQQLLNFSRAGEPVKRVIRLEKVIRESVDFAMSGAPVAAIYLFDPETWPVEADEGQISQVFHNLAINAVHAMPAGGSLTVAMRNADTAKTHAFLDISACVEITVTDQGVGIPGEHLSKVFDPYFTTSENGKGLGLTSVYSIIKRHRGYIRLESEVGKGTTFYIYLPASTGKPEQEVRKEQKQQPSKRGKILFMDDEAIIRQVAGDILKSLGYHAEMAEHGAQALEMYQREYDAGAPFDAVIMDLTIPGGMGGKEASQALLARHPQAKILVSSGYSTDPVLAEHREYGFLGVISKPYRIAEMAAVLEKTIKN